MKCRGRGGKDELREPRPPNQQTLQRFIIQNICSPN